MRGRAFDAALFLAVLPVTATLWAVMCVSTLATAAGTAAFFDGLDAMTTQLEADRRDAAA